MNVPQAALRRLFRIANGGTPTPDAANWGGDVPWATPVDLGKAGQYLGSTDRTLTMAGALSGSTFVPAGSILLSTLAPIGYVAIASEVVAFNQGCKALVPRADVDPRFFYYQLLARVADLQAAGQGSTFMELPNERLASLLVHAPDSDHQRRIADFLDDQVTLIDRAIALREHQSELMDIRTRATSETLLQDLLTREPLVRVQRLVREVDQRAQHDDADDGPLLSVSIHHGVVPRSDLTEKESRADDLSNYKTCKPGDIVVNRMRAFHGGIGVARQPGLVSPDYTVMRPAATVLSEYLNLVFRSPWFVGQMTMRLRGIGGVDQGAVRTPRINYADLRLIEIPSPTLAVQQSLVSALGAHESDTGLTRKALERGIGLLQERKKALITAAVTGEFDVTTASARSVA